MKNEITLTNPTLVRVNDAGQNSTVYSILPAAALSMPKNHVDEYRAAAREVIDGLSYKYKSISIDAIIAAMIIEKLGNDYAGTANEKVHMKQF